MQLLVTANSPDDGTQTGDQGDWEIQLLQEPDPLGILRSNLPQVKWPLPN